MGNSKSKANILLEVSFYDLNDEALGENLSKLFGDLKLVDEEVNAKLDLLLKLIHTPLIFMHDLFDAIRAQIDQQIDALNHHYQHQKHQHNDSSSTTTSQFNKSVNEMRETLLGLLVSLERDLTNRINQIGIERVLKRDDTNLKQRMENLKLDIKSNQQTVESIRSLLVDEKNKDVLDLNYRQLNQIYENYKSIVQNIFDKEIKWYTKKILNDHIIFLKPVNGQPLDRLIILKDTYLSVEEIEILKYVNQE